jgi:hypothetical protein
MTARFLALFVSDALQELLKLNHDLNDGWMLSVSEAMFNLPFCFKSLSLAHEEKRDDINPSSPLFNVTRQSAIQLAIRVARSSLPTGSATVGVCRYSPLRTKRVKVKRHLCDI